MESNACMYVKIENVSGRENNMCKGPGAGTEGSVKLEYIEKGPVNKGPQVKWVL